MDIASLTAVELVSALHSGRMRARDVGEATLVRISEWNETVGAFVHVDAEGFLQQCDAVERGEIRGPLAGVPVPIKDLTPVSGLPCEYGSRIMAGATARSDDSIVRRLRDAGVIIPGKTTTAEFGLTAYTEPTLGPSARTPWDPSRTAGGSSGGAAAAVASGMVPVAHGSDGGGSIRIPAAACGLVGLKPSRGLISPGQTRVEAFGLATAGVLTRTVTDTALCLDALAISQTGDWWKVTPPPSGFFAATRQAPPPLRIGVLTQPLNCSHTDLDPAVYDAIARAEKLLRDCGHQVRPIQRGMTSADWRVFMVLWEVMTASIEIPATSEEMLSPLARYLRQRGERHTAVDVVHALEGMQRLARQLALAWEDIDVVLSPTLSAPPPSPDALQLADPAADIEAQNRFSSWTSVWNMTGAASISLPLHSTTIDGCEAPVSVMLSGTRVGHDATLLQLAYQMESADPWHERQLALIRRGSSNT